MGVPLNHPFLDRIFHYKPSILGTPPFTETPIFGSLIPFSLRTQEVIDIP